MNAVTPADPRMVGVDVGGTFTDVLLFDGVADRVRVRKHLSTPHDPSAAFLEGINSVAADGVAVGALDRLVHATTVATNTVIQRVGARTGLICTAGFRDVLEIGRVPGRRAPPTTCIGPGRGRWCRASCGSACRNAPTARGAS